MEEHPDCDFLGELYMGLELGNSHAGQFFTPYDICRMMVQVTINEDQTKGEIDRRGWISINDCACGAGAMLVAAANYLRSIGINYQQQALFVAQDIDYTVSLMCYIQLSLMGCAGYVRIGNSLSDPLTGNILFDEGGANTWYTPMYFSDIWSMRRAVEKVKIIFGQFDASSKPIPLEEDSTMDSPVEPPGIPLRNSPQSPIHPLKSLHSPSAPRKRMPVN